MEQILFESEWLDFSQDENIPVEVRHNVGQCPVIIKFDGLEGEQVGFPSTKMVDGLPVFLPQPYLTNTTDENVLYAYKPAGFEFNGKFKITIYG
jgi:hypothetical protein